MEAVQTQVTRAQCTARMSGPRISAGATGCSAVWLFGVLIHENRLAAKPAFENRRANVQAARRFFGATMRAAYR